MLNAFIQRQGYSSTILETCTWVPERKSILISVEPSGGRAQCSAAVGTGGGIDAPKKKKKAERRRLWNATKWLVESRRDSLLCLPGETQTARGGGGKWPSIFRDFYDLRPLYRSDGRGNLTRHCRAVQLKQHRERKPACLQAAVHAQTSSRTRSHRRPPRLHSTLSTTHLLVFCSIGIEGDFPEL